MASRSWNRVELIGNLTRDPELRYTPSGTAVATIGLATNRTYNTADGERKEEVDFHKIIAWGKLAELCNQLLKKGARVFMSGRLQYREWQGQDGNKRRDAEIVLEDMILITSKGATGEETSTSDKFSEASMEDVSLPEEQPAKVEKAAPEVAEKEDKPSEAPAKPDETVADEDLPF
jgi:single-strand DNA-binding protein